jgi:hypothetical protein
VQSAYSVPGRRRRRGRRRCRDAPVGAPPEGNAKEVIRRRRRVTMAASSDDSVVSHSSSPAASRVSPSSVVCSTTPLAQTFPQLAQHVVERGALTHSHDSERSSLCSQRGSLRARARSSLRSASLSLRSAPRFALLFEKGSVESTHKVPTSHYHAKHCHAVVASLGGLTHRRGLSRIRPPPPSRPRYIYRPPADSSRDRPPMPPKEKEPATGAHCSLLERVCPMVPPLLKCSLAHFALVLAIRACCTPEGHP